MQQLNQHGLAVQADLSQRFGISQDAARTMMDAVSRGGGTMAQFSHPELGGMGQWSSGGMTMVGDMFNSGLQALVANLCAAISQGYFQGSFYEAAPVQQGAWQGQFQGGPSLQVQGGSFGSWWPSDLGQPSSSGSQNNLSYAIFPQSRRLAVNLNGQVTVYDTGDHMIGGVGQQQSGDASWTFTSQYGTVYLNQLPVVSGQGAGQSVGQSAPQPSWQSAPQPQAQQPAPAPQMAASDVYSSLEKLGALRDAGVLTDAEFETKKAELLSRI